MSGAEEVDAELRTRQIWRKNVPYLYDVMLTKELAWPTLTVEWIPELRYDSEKECNVHRLLIGTDTNDEETNHVMVTEVVLPPQPAQLNMKHYDPMTEEVGGYNVTDARIAIKSEVGLDGNSHDKAKITLVHEGTVRCARCCPQNPNLIATKPGGSGDVLVFDIRLHFWDPKQSTECTPNLRLRDGRGAGEGCALAWSPQFEGRLATSGSDGIIHIFDLNDCSAGEPGPELGPTGHLAGHTAFVEDIAFHLHDPNLLGTASDDRTAALWDLRCSSASSSSGPALLLVSHGDDVNSLSFTPYNPLVVATASSDKVVAIWDLRRPALALHTLRFHTEPVYRVRFAPFHETIVASSGVDGRIILWDLAKIGAAASAEGIPPELLFIHDGHRCPVTDLGWNPNDENDWLLASASENNQLHVWRMADRLYQYG